MEHIQQQAVRRREIFDHMVDTSVTATRWEFCMLRTTQDDRLPRLFYFGPEGAMEMPIQANKAHGDTSDTDAYRRAIGVLGQAGWELATDAYFESRWLDHGRRELYFKRRLSPE